MTIDAQRIQNDVRAVARCTQTPGAGATRPTMSEAWGQARAYVIAQAESAGCAVRIDAAGNVHARPQCVDWAEPAWLVGSHIDSVPHGGDFDGVIGVVLALELLRSAADDGVHDLPVELVVFAEEEGPTFGLGMIGSRLWVGDLNAEALQPLRNADGQNYLEAGVAYGVDARRFADHRIDPTRYLGLIEVHIEQGPGMWRRDQRLGVVKSIAGRRQYWVVVHGEANHAGATAMDDRKDALVAASHIVLSLRAWVRELSTDAVITVGRMEVSPNAVNVIAERVQFTIDFRAPSDELLQSGDESLRVMLPGIAQSHGVEIELAQTESIPARPMDLRLVEALHGEAVGLSATDVPIVVSGALHDAAVLAPYVPTAMLFVPSRDGISHNPQEFSRFEDIAAAARVVEGVVRRPTLARLSAMPKPTFVHVCGDAFEHSPWVAERAWSHRPFENLDSLLSAMRDVLERAGEDERLALIRAHPDLVGRLARAGAMTAASVAEQRHAGLHAVSDDEADAFARLNAAYREKFGFPFVICARANRKDAILEAMPRRLQNPRGEEIATAIREIVKIAEFRLKAKLWEQPHPHD